MDLHKRPTAVPATMLGVLLVRAYPMAPPAAVRAARTYAGNSRPCARVSHKTPDSCTRNCTHHFDCYGGFVAV